jgi:hypothetical protein
MITLSKLEQITKLREKELRIPIDNKFTQKTAIEMKLEELRNIDTVLADENINFVMTNDFNKNSKQETMETMETMENMEDMEDIELNYQENIGDDDDDIYGNLKGETVIIYEENEVCNIPNNISCLNLPDEWYIYGTKNPNSFYKSILYLTSPDSILQSNKEKKNYVAALKQEMALMTETLYKKYKYRKLKFNHKNISQELMDGSDIKYSHQVLTTDYIKSNICILDIIVKRYRYIESASNISNDTVLIIEENGNYLPVMHSSGKHILPNGTIDLIKKNYECSLIPDSYRERILNQVEDTVDVVDVEDTVDVVEVKDNSESSTIKKKLKETLLSSELKYKISELVEIATSLSINHKKQGKKGEINKNKKELYQEIKNSL